MPSASRFPDFLDLRKTAIGGQQPLVNPFPDFNNLSSTSTPLPAVNDANQFRFRRFHGVNMGSWFVNEQWICQSVFKNAASPQQSDLDICKGSNAKANLESHWDSWITTSDWQFIVNQGLNTIRLPIGYYHLSQASIIANTDFAPYGTVFSGAWQRVLNAISTARSFGLGVLVDLHAAPGGQNNQPHSGTSSGVAGLWGNPTNLARTQQALNFLVQQLNNIDNVVGIELLNEPQNSDSLSAWYISTIQQLRTISSDMPLYIHDAFDPNFYAGFVGSRTDLGFVVQDTHYYRCFSSSDTAMSSDAIIADVQNTTNTMWANIASRSQGKIICGEWSAALAPSSLVQSSRSQDSSRGFFAFVQLAMFKQDIAGGWMFWTIKKESGTDTGWSLQNARAANTVPPDFSTFFVIPNDPSATVDKQATMRTALNKFRQKLQEYPALHGRQGATLEPLSEAATEERQELKDESQRGLTANPNITVEAQSQLFQQGFEVGFNDAQTFALGVSVQKGSNRTGRIGHTSEWKRVRTLQFLKAQDAAQSKSMNLWQKLLKIAHKGPTETEASKLARAWEFTDGLEAGIQAVQQTTPEQAKAMDAWEEEIKKAFAAEVEKGSQK